MRDGWSGKSLHRLMVTSSTYRQSSQRNSQLAAADPDGRLLSHMPLRRMEAESVRDSLFFVAGQLNETSFGPPDEVTVRDDGLVTAKGTHGGGRRSIYVLHRRTKLPTILENFDSPQMGPNCVERGESIVAPQALHLLNNGAIYELAGRFAERVQRESGSDLDMQIHMVHNLALARSPTQEELNLARESIVRFTEQWRATLGEGTASPHEAQQRALRNYCHAIMNSAAFVYVD